MTIERPEGFSVSKTEWKYRGTATPEILQAETVVSQVLTEFREIPNDQIDFVENVCICVDEAFNKLAEAEARRDKEGKLVAHDILHTARTLSWAFDIAISVRNAAIDQDLEFDVSIIGLVIIAASFHDSVYLSYFEGRPLFEGSNFITSTRQPMYGDSESSSSGAAQRSMDSNFTDEQRKSVSRAIITTKPDFDEQKVFHQNIAGGDLVAAILSAADIGAVGIDADEYMSDGKKFLHELYPYLLEHAIRQEIDTGAINSDATRFVLDWHRKQWENIEPVHKKLVEQLRATNIEEWQKEVIISFVSAEVQESERKTKARFEFFVDALKTTSALEFLMDAGYRLVVD